MSADEGPVVVAGGTISRTERCAACGARMMFRVDNDDFVRSKFCPSYACGMWLVEVLP